MAVPGLFSRLCPALIHTAVAHSTHHSCAWHDQQAAPGCNHVHKCQQNVARPGFPWLPPPATYSLLDRSQEGWRQKRFELSRLKLLQTITLKFFPEDDPPQGCFQVFLDEDSAHKFLGRRLLYNHWDLEAFTPDNLERECIEEICTYEEARECFENDQLTKQFWDKYPHNGKGGDTSSSTNLDIAALVAGITGTIILLIMVLVVVMYCVKYRAKERRRSRVPVSLTGMALPTEGVPLTVLPGMEPPAPGLPSYEEALEASGTYDAPPPPYQRGSTRSTEPS